MALEGGCRWVQLRMKEASEEEIIAIGLKVRKLCNQYQATFIIDDHVELVQAVGADGVHLGKKDMPVAQARAILGNDYIIGGTANTFDDVRMHYEGGANYVGCGPFRFTTTKKGLAPILGIEGYQQIIRQMQEAGIHLPVVAIGGITAADIPAILTTGVTDIALSGTILNASDPVNKTKEIISKIINQ